ncbi:MAG TPA: hypothetical protein VGO93_23775 [Candidatus Xenobia bacterium]
MISESFTVKATGSDTVTFAGRQAINFLFLSNVQLTSPSTGGAPELDAETAIVPAAVALGVLLVLTDRRRKSPVQPPA